MAIDEKKLIEDIEEYQEWIFNETIEWFKHEGLFASIYEIIKAQPKLSLETKTSDKWIPVTERLPEENKEVLIQIWYGTMTVGCLLDNRWISEAWPYQIHEVAAWMPLPDAYKGE